MIQLFGFGTREEKAEITLDTLLNSEQFKCSRCKNSLSIAPIVALGNEDMYCGRCKDAIYDIDSNPKIERQILYEKIAEHIQFSCRYERVGCKELVEWKHVEEHEKTCKFRGMRCFFRLDQSEECDWTGETHEYFQHIDEAHTESFGGIHRLEAWDYMDTLVFRIDFLHRLLLAVLFFIDGIYYFTLIGNDKDSPVEYTIEIEDETYKISRIFRQFSTFLPCSFGNLKKFGIKLDPEDFKPKYFSFYFGERCRCINECNAIILPRCDICGVVMMAPIFMCELEHKSCEKCLNIQKDCKFSEGGTDCGKNLRINTYGKNCKGNIINVITMDVVIMATFWK